MPYRMSTSALRSLSLSLLICGSCTVPKDAGFHAIKTPVRERSVPVKSHQTLSVEQAVSLALTHNPTMKQLYSRLGVGQADLIEAKIIDNPDFGVAFGFPHQAPSGTEIEYALTQPLLNLLMLKARKNLARKEFEATQNEITHEVLALVRDVKVAYYGLQAASDQHRLQQKLTKAKRAAFKLADEQHDEGNLDELEYSEKVSDHEMAKLDLQEAKLTVDAQKSELATLLGLPPSTWSIDTHLANLPRHEPFRDDLVSHAIAHRHDLRALHKRLETLQLALKTARFWRWIPGVEVSGYTAKDDEAARYSGVELGLTLPIFDRSQATIRRLESELEATEASIAELEAKIASDVELQVKALKIARTRVSVLGKRIIPLHERIVQLGQQEHNFMLKGTYELLALREEEIETTNSWVDAKLAFWTLQAELEHTLGGSLQ